MPANDRRQYWQELDRSTREIEQQYSLFVASTVSAVTVTSVIAAIEAGNVDAIPITSASLTGVNESVRATYLRGGQFEAPAARIQFDIRNTRAEAWLREQSSDLITRVSESQREATRIVMQAGMAQGRNPRQTALDIVGRVGATGRRSGGIVGLSAPQAEYVTSARAELSTGNPRYFTRTRRDRRFDAMIRKAFDSGKPIPAADVDRIVGRYADRLLFTRGEAIARTEATAALNAAREEAMMQSVEAGNIHRDLITRYWDSAGDARTRPAHAAMDGQSRPAGQPFQSPTGVLMMHPGDSSMGAGAEDVANCRCFERIRYDFIGAANR